MYEWVRVCVFYEYVCVWDTHTQRQREIERYREGQRKLSWVYTSQVILHWGNRISLIEPIRLSSCNYLWDQSVCVTALEESSLHILTEEIGVHVSEESHLEELLAKRLNNHPGGFAGNQRKLLELELYCSKGYFFFFHGPFNKFEMCTTPMALGTSCHLVRLGRLLPACSLCERVWNLKGWRDCQNSKCLQA